MVRRSSGAPSRGQWPSRWRSTCRSPVCEPPRRYSVRDGRADAPARCRHSSRSRSAAGRAGSSEAAPQRLVHQQVAEAGDVVLVEEPGLQRRPAAAQRLDDLADRDRPGVGTEHRQVRVELDPAEASGVGQPQPRAVGEAQLEAVPRRQVPTRRSTRAARSAPRRRPRAGRSCRSAGRGPARRRRGRRSRRLPWRLVPTTDLPSTAATTSAGRAPPFRNQASGATTSSTVAPTTRSASCR